MEHRMYSLHSAVREQFVFTDGEARSSNLGIAVRN